jgi:hypothetical protein
MCWRELDTGLFNKCVLIFFRRQRSMWLYLLDSTLIVVDANEDSRAVWSPELD